MPNTNTETETVTPLPTEITPEQRARMEARADAHFLRMTVSPNRPKLKPGRYCLQRKTDGHWVRATTGAESTVVQTTEQASVAHAYGHAWLNTTTWEWEREYEARDKAYTDKAIKLEAKSNRGKSVKEDGK